jgi:hypothetical protein
MVYTTIKPEQEYGIFPFDLQELVCPKSVVFINIDKHAKETHRKVTEEWNLINTSIQTPVPMISLNKLNKLTTIQRNLKKLQGQAGFVTKHNQLAKSANIKFSKTQPTTINLAKHILKIINKMAFVNHSMNIFKSVKPTYNRPNRRDPDDFNKQGKMVSTKYKPDIHLYVDTSGSISERNYQDAVKACIQMAIKFNINLYFNSFSNYLSQEAKLHTKDKTVSAVYQEFKKIPKVTGGTDYSNVWNFINRNKKRKQELSIIMTDFEYLAPTGHIEHPKNLYYIPVSHTDWKSITYWAERFAKSMAGEVPDIRKHILFQNLHKKTRESYPRLSASFYYEKNYYIRSTINEYK